MRTTEVVVHVMEGHGSYKVLYLLGEGVCQSRKPPHAHPHGEVLALHIGRTDVLGIGVTRDAVLLGSDALGRAVPVLPIRGTAAVDLLEHGVVHVTTKPRLYRFQVHLVPVTGELNTTRQAGREVHTKLRGRRCVAEPYQEGRHELRLGVNRGKRPYVPIAEGAALFDRDVLLLRVDKRPYLVYLDALAGQLPQVLILVGGTDRPQLYQELQDSVLGYTRHPDRAVDGVALYQGGDDGGSLLGLQDVCHTDYYTCPGRKSQEGSSRFDDLSISRGDTGGDYCYT